MIYFHILIQIYLKSYKSIINRQLNTLIQLADYQSPILHNKVIENSNIM